MQERGPWAASHLVTYDLRTGETRDHGEMRLPDGRIVIGTNSAHTADDGTVYFVGAIEVRPETGKPVEAAGKIGDSILPPGARDLPSEVMP